MYMDAVQAPVIDLKRIQELAFMGTSSHSWRRSVCVCVCVFADRSVWRTRVAPQSETEAQSEGD